MTPWGTPAPISVGADVQPSTVVIWRRDVKKLFMIIQANAEPLIPAASSFDRSATPDRMHLFKAHFKAPKGI